MEVCEDWKKANATDNLNMDKKMNQRTTDWSALPQALEMGHTRYETLANSKPARITSQVGRWVPLGPIGESPTNTHNFLLVQICASDSAGSKYFSYMAFFSAATMAKRRQENTFLQPPQSHLISYFTQS